MLPLLFQLLARDTSGYWQQQVTYRITASLDEPSAVLTGHAEIVYINHSPDTLRDFYVQQYLNAFRPGSRWAAADSAEEVDRFQHLKDPDYGFERFSHTRIAGADQRPDYPFAPDSTVAHWHLAKPLAPGDSLVADLDWQARLSTVPRRQGRQGRRFDFAQWYPKVAVYDKYGWEDHPLYPAGEFYGEFATFDVTLDLASDQVIGATGVPVEGDPGWQSARADPTTPVDYQRDFYREVPATCPAATAPGRKCVHFHAEQVHHFAFSLNPAYVYEQGRYKDVAVHVLYLPEDAATWGNGIVVNRAAAALDWLDTLFGKSEWPQLTVAHRIEGGGTEFPMMEMNGGPSIGVIIHETGHQYVMGQLANNEWREGWLDEGFTSFQSGWFLEAHGARGSYEALEPSVLWLDLHRWSEPVSMVSERYRDFVTYNEMIYSKARLFYEELRYVVGDETMRRILRTYFARWKLHHVDEEAFRSVCEEVSGQDLGWLFGQWLHGTPLIDYRLARVERRRVPEGWRTTVTIERRGDGWMPVEIGDRDTIYARATGQPAVERVEFTSARRPGRITLDPRGRTHDWNALNNSEERPLVGRGTWEPRFDNPTKDFVRRDRLVTQWMPVAWYNDHGGVSVGLRDRTNYLGMFDRDQFIGAVGTGSDATNRVGGYFRVTNPVGRGEVNPTTSMAVWDLEGRTGVSLDVDRSLRRHITFGPDPHAGFTAIWMATSDLGYLDRRLWDDAGTVEAGPWVATTVEHGATVVRAQAITRAGVAYRAPPPGTASDEYTLAGFARLTGDVSLRAKSVLGTRLGIRLFGGAYLSGSDPVKQRRIMLGGADPYETFTNPLLRSAGALFVRPDFQYQEPGDANLRGFNPTLGGRWAASLNVELTRSVITRKRGFVRDVALEGFFDGGLVDSAAVPSASGTSAATTLWDGGVGLVTTTAIHDLVWVTRFELPLLVNRWDHAADVRSGEARAAFRWSVSLAPSF